jgi:hypothetical protein
MAAGSKYLLGGVIEEFLVARWSGRLGAFFCTVLGFD